MSEHYLTSQYDKKSKYNYGLKNSNLYGANLGSVFADGPPPLDDTLEDDDGDIVFRDNQSKLAANLSDTSKASQLCNESINGASISNQNTSPDPSDNTKDDDFGGFASFGNFSDDGNAKDSLATSWTITPSNATKTSPSIEKFPKDSNRKTENSLKASDNFGCFSDSDEEFESFQSSEVQPDMHAVKSSNGSVLPVNLSPNNFHVSNVDGDDFQSHHIKESIPDNHVSKVAKSPGVQDGFECFSDSDDDFESFQSSQVPSNLPAYKSSTSVQVSNNQPSNHNDKHASGSEGILFDTGKSGTTNKEEPHEIDDHKKVESLGNLSSDEDFGDFALHSPPPLDDLTSSKTGHSDIESISSGDNGFGGSTCKDNSFSPKEMASSTSDSQLDSKREQGNSDYGFKDSGGSQSGSKGISIVKSRHVSDSQRNRDSPKELRHQGDNRHFSCAALSSDKEPGDNHFGEFAESSSEGQQSSKELPSLQMDISSYSGKDTPDDDNSFSNLQAITKGNEDGVEQPTDNSIHATVASHNDDDFDDFDGFKASIPTTTDSKSDDPHIYKIRFEKNEDDDFGDFDGFKASVTTTTDSKFEGSHGHKMGLEEKQKEDDDDFGDFDGFKASVTTTTDSKLEGSHGHKMGFEENQNEDDDDFGDFDGFKASVTTTTDSKFEGSHGHKMGLEEKQKEDDDDFGDFDGFKASVTTTTDSKLEGSHGHKMGFEENQNEDDDDFGDFDGFKKASPPEQKQLKSTETSDSDDYGDFSNFETPTKESYNKSDGCTGQKGKLNANKDDDFGDFSDSDMKSNSLKTVIPKIALQTKQSQANPSNEKERVDDGFADFSSSETSGFAEFSSANKSHSDPSDTTFKKTSIETTTISQSSTSQKGLSIFKPHPNSMISQLAGPVSLSITRPDDFKLGKSLVVSFLLKILENNKSSSMLKELLMSQQDGSLRFEWSLSCHHSKLLEALNMLPVRSQTTTSFQSTSKSTVMPFFSTGMTTTSFQSTSKSTVMPFFSTGMVGLGLAKSALSRQSAPLDSKDNSSSDSLSSESSSLDLDFLASSTSARKPAENRGVYEQELLGLSLQPSDTASPSPFAESPSLPSGAEAKKVFKFGNVLIPLNSDQGNKNLSGAAKEIADDLEDLSFMLSKVLMFPLKSK
ncbi:predicted protein [Nematostella vectensis]|uniref:Uncharacterized protein n=1 Tax=Nematostella vectensis TaxID=45351 RepID=A7SHM8_NEMVE|nr:predicted protein [Nematostella vectensis]|eukprot:XP_001628825.1 predicted protein [Nematostella vectensis]